VVPYLSSSKSVTPLKASDGHDFHGDGQDQQWHALEMEEGRSIISGGDMLGLLFPKPKCKDE
jgi:hypothetical protein